MLRRRVNMGELTLPSSVRDIDAGWLTAALRGGGALTTGRVSRCEVTVIGEGQGFIGELARVSAEYEPASTGPATLIAKLPTQDPEIRPLAMQARLYEYEASFYRDLAAKVPVRTAQVYFNGMDVAGGSYALLLEDLAGWRIGDQVAECSRADALLAIEHLADLHALFWGKPELDEVPWLVRPDDPTRAAMLSALYPWLWAPFIGRADGRLSPRAVAIGAGLGPHLPRLAGLLSREPRTLLHGDFRLDNMFFGPAAGADEFALIDWQTCGRGRAMSDVAYFLMGSLAPEQRRAWEGGLLAAYRSRLAERGIGLQSAEEYARDIRAAALSQFGLLVLLLSGADFDAGDRPAALAKVTLERLNAFVEDHNFEDLLSG